MFSIISRIRSFFLNFQVTLMLLQRSRSKKKWKKTIKQNKHQSACNYILNMRLNKTQFLFKMTAISCLCFLHFLRLEAIMKTTPLCDTRTPNALGKILKRIETPRNSFENISILFITFENLIKQKLIIFLSFFH